MRMLRRLLVASLSLVSTACTTFYDAPPEDDLKKDTAADAHAAWGRVLAANVDAEGRVAFDRLAASRDFKTYIAYIGRESPIAQPEKFPTPQATLAELLNQYNALAMYGVVKTGEREGFTTFFKRLGFFKLTEFRMGGREISLYDLENDVVRPMGDPRVHTALNCMSTGCPRLPQKPYTAAGLDRELDAGAREFFNKTKYVQVDASRRVARLSEILKFFTGDFVNSKQATSLIAYVNRYRRDKIPEDYAVEFIPYDWALFKQ